MNLFLHRSAGAGAAVVLGLCCAVSTSAAQKSGIAFDEVVKMYVTRPLPQPQDFATVWSATLDELRTHAKDAPPASSSRFGQASHVSILGDLKRTDYPVTGDFTIENPSLHEMFFVDPARRSYYIRKLVGKREIYSDGPPMPAFTGRQVDPHLDVTFLDWPAIEVGGFTFTGRATRAFVSVPAAGACRPASTLIMITLFATTALTEPEFDEHSYAFPLSVAGSGLSRISGCRVRAPAKALSAFPTYPGFILYRESTMLSSPLDLRFAFMRSNIPATVMMRGNLRRLSDADARLFEIPDGYVRVPPPSSAAMRAPNDGCVENKNSYHAGCSSSARF